MIADEDGWLKGERGDERGRAVSRGRNSVSNAVSAGANHARALWREFWFHNCFVFSRRRGGGEQSFLLLLLLSDGCKRHPLGYVHDRPDNALFVPTRHFHGDGAFACVCPFVKPKKYFFLEEEGYVLNSESKKWTEKDRPHWDHCIFSVNTMIDGSGFFSLLKSWNERSRCHCDVQGRAPSMET